MSDKHVATKPLSMTESVNMNEAMTISVLPARSVIVLNMLNEGSSRDPRVIVTLGDVSSGLLETPASLPHDAAIAGRRAGIMDTGWALRRINFS